MKRLSYIVPFYNVELYIEECIRSIYNQDIPTEDYEVICVDDCSPDGSRAIVERLQKEYPTLQLLTTPENLRQGGARNMALEIAKGNYICFVDSDDYLMPNTINRLLEQAEENNLDILDFDFDSGAVGEKMGMRKNPTAYTIGVCTGTDYVFDERSLWANKCCCVCAMLISKKFLDNHNLRFVEKLQYEDTDFSMRMFSLADRVIHVGDKAYIYRYITDSATHATIIDYKNLYYRISLVQRYIEFYNKVTTLSWREAVHSIINNNTLNVLKDLRGASVEVQKDFYKNKLGCIDGLQNFVGKKSRLALRSKLMLNLFF